MQALHLPFIVYRSGRKVSWFWVQSKTHRSPIFTHIFHPHAKRFGGVITILDRLLIWLVCVSPRHCPFWLIFNLQRQKFTIYSRPWQWGLWQLLLWQCGADKSKPAMIPLIIRNVTPKKRVTFQPAWETAVQVWCVPLIWRAFRRSWCSESKLG